MRPPAPLGCRHAREKERDEFSNPQPDELQKVAVTHELEHVLLGTGRDRLGQVVDVGSRRHVKLVLFREEFLDLLTRDAVTGVFLVGGDAFLEREKGAREKNKQQQKVGRE